MNDPGVRSAERGEQAIAKRIRAIYGKAKKEIEETIREYNLRFMEQDKEMQELLAAKKITKDQYDAWLKRTVFSGKAWDEKVSHCTEIMADANKSALKVIRGEQIGVFAENMSFQAYELEKNVGVNLGFGIYDSSTVNNLLKKQPELLPRRVLDGVKDRAWNKNKIANEITKSIIKGDGIGKVAESLAETLGMQNDSAMMRYARTAMTSAQNAGRMEMLHEADEKGVKARKKWIATLDNRTRDAHADLDGEVVEVDEYFKNSIGEIMFPGDPTADPANVYNCRCTLGYVVDGFNGRGERRAYTEDENGNRTSYTISNMTYREWQVWKREQGRH